MLRQVTESLVLLAVAVALFRSFGVEGYLISTGSMAPSLLGYHRRIVCPACDYLFAQGAAFDGDFPSEQDHSPIGPDAAWADFDTARPLALAECPNCGCADLSPAGIPRNEGDQLLVHKHAYLFRDPKRWEVIVFRNPDDPRQAYVKRVIGLPGETIELRDGEVYADGLLCRKPYPVQKSIRVPIADFVHRSRDPFAWDSTPLPVENGPGLEATSIPMGEWNDPDDRPRWFVLGPDPNRHPSRSAMPDSRWQLEPEQLTFHGIHDPLETRTDWIEYRHAIRTGGQHRTEVELSRWPRHLDPPHPHYSNLTCEQGRLICTGVLSDVERRRWLARDDSPEFQQAVNELFERSHRAPITDRHGYNVTEPETEYPVRDFFVSLELARTDGGGRFEIELTDGERRFRSVFDFSANQILLLADDDPVPLRDAPLDPETFSEPVLIEFSSFDRQALLAVNGVLPFPPFPFDDDRSRGPQADEVSVNRPLRIGAAGLDCTVRELRLYRDVYYQQRNEETTEPPKDGSDPVPYRPGNDAFFVLGDNSAVSVDSRLWKRPGVPREALIGKPFLVHLPSKQGQIEWRGEVHAVRLPDFSRVRVVR
jgi:signal peptidase I